MRSSRESELGPMEAWKHVTKGQIAWRLEEERSDESVELLKSVG